MLQAMLRGKLTRPEEGMEDLLTSNTLGLLKYMPPEDALLPFLGSAINPLTGDKLSDLLATVTRVESWRFWPPLDYSECNPCEPDVEIILSDGDRNRVGVFIEAKYRSGKSGFTGNNRGGPTDQLSRELDNLRVMAREEQFRAFAVIYLTTSVSCPVDDFHDSSSDYLSYRDEPVSIFWLSWRALPEILITVREPFFDMATDLRNLLLQLGLTAFTELRIKQVSIPEWTFAAITEQKKEIGPRWIWELTGPSWQFSGCEVSPIEHITQPTQDDSATTFSVDKPLPRLNKLYHWRTMP